MLDFGELRLASQHLLDFGELRLASQHLLDFGELRLASQHLLDWIHERLRVLEGLGNGGARSSRGPTGGLLYSVRSALQTRESDAPRLNADRNATA